MKHAYLFTLIVMVSLLVSACGAIPTLPPLDSTVTIRTPRFTAVSGLPTGESQLTPGAGTETPVESTSEPPDPTGVGVTPSSTPIEPSQTPYPTATASPTETSTPTLNPSPTSLPSPTPTATALPYQVQALNPYYLANFTHPDLGCSWMGVAGQVFDSAGLVQKDILIKAGGALDGSPLVEEMTMPLSDPETDAAYGPGGFEITLADQPAASDGSIWVQLFSLDGNPLSEKIYLTTYQDCQKNLILLNFMEQ